VRVLDSHGFFFAVSRTVDGNRIFDRGLLWSDSALSVGRPVPKNEALVSDKDRKNPVFSRLSRYFRYEPPINPQGWGQ
jgi:dTDP-4-dehydrorhamnose 3,5-epimerase-like enzyme